MGSIGCPEASVTDSQSTQRNIVEEQRSQEYFCFSRRMMGRATCSGDEPCMLVPTYLVNDEMS
jgi:hypothetical protein